MSVKAAGPAGKDELLVLVSDSHRDLKALSLSEPTSAAPFTYALTDLGGRAALIDFLTGRGVQGRSESFGAAMFSVVGWNTRNRSETLDDPWPYRPVFGRRHGADRPGKLER